MEKQIQADCLPDPASTANRAAPNLATVLSEEVSKRKLLIHLQPPIREGEDYFTSVTSSKEEKRMSQEFFPTELKFSTVVDLKGSKCAFLTLLQGLDESSVFHDMFQGPLATYDPGSPQPHPLDGITWGSIGKNGPSNSECPPTTC